MVLQHHGLAKCLFATSPGLGSIWDQFSQTSRRALLWRETRIVGNYSRRALVSPVHAALMATSSEPGQGRRGFAPLNPDLKDGRDQPKLKGIVFDVDGTLCLPQNYMFKEMRAALGIPKGVDILDHIRDLSNVPDTDPVSQTESQSSVDASPQPVAAALSHTASPPDPAPTSPQARAVAKIRHIERTAMSSQRPQPGLKQLMSYLTSRGVPKALCTRNFPAPVHHLLDKFLQGEVFEPIITRDTEGIAPKPSPEGLWSIAQAWGLDRDVDDDAVAQRRAKTGLAEVDPLELAKRLGSGLIMVGDSVDDITAGRRAGAATVLLANDENEHLVEHECTDLSIRRLDELIDILERGFEAHK